MVAAILLAGSVSMATSQYCQNNPADPECVAAEEGAQKNQKNLATGSSKNFSAGKALYMNTFGETYGTCIKRYQGNSGGSGQTIIVHTGGGSGGNIQNTASAANHQQCQKEAQAAAEKALVGQNYGNDIASCLSSSAQATLVCNAQDGTSQYVNSAVGAISAGLQMGTSGVNPGSSTQSMVAACQAAQASGILGYANGAQMVTRCEVARRNCTSTCSAAKKNLENYQTGNKSSLITDPANSAAYLQTQQATQEASECTGLRANSIAAAGITSAMGALNQSMMNCKNMVACAKDPYSVSCLGGTPAPTPSLQFCQNPANLTNPQCLASYPDMCDDPTYSSLPNCICKKNPTSPTCKTAANPTIPPWNLNNNGGLPSATTSGGLPATIGGNIPLANPNSGAPGLLDESSDPTLAASDIKGGPSQNPGVANGGAGGSFGGGGVQGAPIGGSERGAASKPDSDIITGKENGGAVTASSGGAAAPSDDSPGSPRGGGSGKGNYNLSDYLPGKMALSRKPAAADQDLIQAKITPAMGLSNWEKVNLKMNEKVSGNFLNYN